MLSLQDGTGSGDASVNSEVNFTGTCIGDEVIDGAPQSQNNNLDEEDVALEGSDDTHKRKLDSSGEATSLDIDSKRSSRSRYKMWRPW